MNKLLKRGGLALGLVVWFSALGIGFSVIGTSPSWVDDVNTISLDYHSNELPERDASRAIVCIAVPPNNHNKTNTLVAIDYAGFTPKQHTGPWQVYTKDRDYSCLSTNGESARLVYIKQVKNENHYKGCVTQVDIGGIYYFEIIKDNYPRADIGCQQVTRGDFIKRINGTPATDYTVGGENTTEVVGS